MSAENMKRALRFTIPIFILLFSVIVMSGWVGSMGYVRQTAQSLDESKEIVLKLAAASTGASVAISMLPGDIGTPVADKLAEMSELFLLILCAIYLEQFLLSVSGLLAFKGLVPFACILYILSVIFRREKLKRLMVKVLILTAAVLLVIPSGVWLADRIKEANAETIDQTIASAEYSSEQIQAGYATEEEEAAQSNGLDSIIRKLKAAGDSVAHGSTQLLDYFKKLLNRFIDALAIMIVTCCVIPLIVVLFFIWLLKILFQMDIGVKLFNVQEYIQGAKKPVQAQEKNSLKEISPEGALAETEGFDMQ